MGKLPIIKEVNGVKVMNAFSQEMTPSQKKWLGGFLNLHNRVQKNVLVVYLSKVGYMGVIYKRDSTKYPYGREIRGRRGGWISSAIGDYFDKETCRMTIKFEEEPK